MSTKGFVSTQLTADGICTRTNTQNQVDPRVRLLQKYKGEHENSGGHDTVGKEIVDLVLDRLRKPAPQPNSKLLPPVRQGHVGEKQAAVRSEDVCLA